jgi:hypothetical protein
VSIVWSRYRNQNENGFLNRDGSMPKEFDAPEQPQRSASLFRAGGTSGPAFGSCDGTSHLRLAYDRGFGFQLLISAAHARRRCIR